MLVALAPTAAALEDRVDVHVVTLRHVDVSIYTSLPGPAGDAFRAEVDGNEDGTVSGEEYAVYVSALEVLVFADPVTSIEAYQLVWRLENETGAAEFTAAGRFSLGTLVATQAPGFQVSATMDGEPGDGRVTYLSLPGLAGPVASNASVDAAVTMRFEWAPRSSFETHTLEVSGPPLMPLQVRMPGSSYAADVQGVSGFSEGAGGSTVRGTTTTAPVQVTIVPREPSFTGLWMAVTVIAGALVVVGYGAIVVTRSRDPR